MMSRQLIIKIGPNEKMRFPGLCTNCANPASESMELFKRDGRTCRCVDVPICVQCAGQLNKTSAAEERLQKQSWLFAALAAVLLFFAGLLLLSGFPFWLRLLAAILLAIIAGAIVIRLFHTAIAKAALPQKKAVIESAQLQAFTWRTAAFKFDNETFIERFIDLNEPLILET